ncbi:MAG: hypothetical protein ACQEWM_05565 [Actinomycetota bacterium]
MLRRLASGAALVAAAVLLAGCTPPEPVETTPAPTPGPSSSTSPSVDPEERLVERSFQVSTELLDLVDQGFRDGSLPEEDLRRIATDELIAMINTDLAQFQEQGLQVSGSSDLDSPSLVSHESSGDGSGALVLATCWDTSGTRTVGPDGEVVSGGVTRQPRLFEIQYSTTEMRVTRTGPPSDSAEVPGCG